MPCRPLRMRPRRIAAGDVAADMAAGDGGARAAALTRPKHGRTVEQDIASVDDISAASKEERQRRREEKKPCRRLWTCCCERGQGESGVRRRKRRHVTVVEVIYPVDVAAQDDRGGCRRRCGRTVGRVEYFCGQDRPGREEERGPPPRTRLWDYHGGCRLHGHRCVDSCGGCR